jgi:hypothetical protein
LNIKNIYKNDQNLKEVNEVFSYFYSDKKKKKANVTCKSQKKWLVMPKPKRHITANQVVVAMLVSGKKKKKIVIAMLIERGLKLLDRINTLRNS